MIHDEFARTVERVLHPTWTALYVRRNDEKPLEAMEASPLIAHELLDLLHRVELEGESMRKRDAALTSEEGQAMIEKS